MRLAIKIYLFFFIGMIAFVNTQASTYRIYLDADRSNHLNSAKSIEMGVKTAFSEVNNLLGNYNVEFVVLDHKGNDKRSKMHMDQFLKDPHAIVYYGGLHSPPLIHYRKFINDNKMLTLVPWAAGAPITRYPSADNWIFRLSVDDKKAGKYLINYAVMSRQCKNIHLLMEKTKWGEWNEKNMQTAYKEKFGITVPTTWFKWKTSETVVHMDLNNIDKRNTDCIVFVGNSVEGLLYMRAAANKQYDFKFISHWGITGGSFHRQYADYIREKNIQVAEKSLTFLQTCFSLLSENDKKIPKVFRQAKSLFPNLNQPSDIKAATGFIHAYDLSKILIASANQQQLTGDIVVDRALLKAALENLQQPVDGLVKTYVQPFSLFSKDNDDAHEALGEEDLCMGEYQANGSVKLIGK